MKTTDSPNKLKLHKIQKQSFMLMLMVMFLHSLFQLSTELNWWMMLLTLQGEYIVYSMRDLNSNTWYLIHKQQAQKDSQFICIFSLSRAKYINTTLALRTTKYLRSEREYMPWESALDNLDFFYLMFDRSEIYGDMQVGLLSRKAMLKNKKHFTNNIMGCILNKIVLEIILFLMFVLIFQTYLKYQIEPLFKHFGNITGNWTEVPTGHMDQ